MLCATFKNPVQEDEINENGYIVIKNFLDANQVNYLKGLYENQHCESEIGCWNSLYDLPIGQGRELSDKVVKALEPKFQELFNNAVFPVALYISKNPHKGHASLVHRDDSMHNEEEVQYRQCWMPLVDITKKNGALYVVPKSHLLFKDERPMFAPWGYDHLRDRLEHEFEVLYLNAGDLVVYFEKTLHGSYLNNSEEKRPVLQGAVLHKDSEPFFTRFNSAENVVEYFKVTNDFFLNKEYMDESKIQQYDLVEKKPFKREDITVKDIDNFYGEVSMMRKLKKTLQL